MTLNMPDINGFFVDTKKLPDKGIIETIKFLKNHC